MANSGKSADFGLYSPQCEICHRIAIQVIQTTGQHSFQTGGIESMAEDTATELELLPSDAAEAILSPSAIAGLLLEIQSSLLETPEHAHLADPAEDLLLGLVRSIKNAEALAAAGITQAGKPAAMASGDDGKPRLRVVTSS